MTSYCFYEVDGKIIPKVGELEKDSGAWGTFVKAAVENRRGECPARWGSPPSVLGVCVVFWSRAQ